MLKQFDISKYSLCIFLGVLIIYICGAGSFLLGYFQLMVSKDALQAGEQIILQAKLNQSLEEEYRITITYWAQIYGNDIKKSLAICKAESGFRNICNADGCEFGQGLFMFIQSSWELTGLKMKQKTGNVMDPYLNIQRAMYLLAVEGDKHWDQSRDNWDNYD